MKKSKFQRNATTRILSAAPDLRYVAYYRADDERLKVSMLEYENRCFVYVLTVDYHGSEEFIYVGKSTDQYARLLTHLSKFQFEYVYLFECQPEHLNQAEASVIKALCPLYNRQHNPLVERNRMLLRIDYNARKDTEAIHHDLDLVTHYSTTHLYGFALPIALFKVLEHQASISNRTCSEQLQYILENAYTQEIADQIPRLEDGKPNLISVQAYAEQNRKSPEQIKSYCHKYRLEGAMRIGRDWVIPKDARFPEDHRRRGAK